MVFTLCCCQRRVCWVSSSVAESGFLPRNGKIQTDSTAQWNTGSQALHLNRLPGKCPSHHTTEHPVDKISNHPSYPAKNVMILLGFFFFFDKSLYFTEGLLWHIIPNSFTQSTPYSYLKSSAATCEPRHNSLRPQELVMKKAQVEFKQLLVPVTNVRAHRQSFIADRWSHFLQKRRTAVLCKAELSVQKSDKSRSYLLDKETHF